MQQPTLINVRIRSTLDAHRIFYAVQKGRLEKIKRRLDAEERNALQPGCIYVWEQRGSQTVDVTGLGIERFTEGKKWTASRVRDEFLFYYEIKPNDAPIDWDQLIKQTYSVWVNKKEGRRKWHLTAYFSEKTVNDLQTIDSIPALSHLFPPPGLYTSPRVGRRPQGKDPSGPSRPRRATTDRTYAPFPSGSSSEPVTMYNPYNDHSPPQRSPSPIAAVEPLRPLPSSRYGSRQSPTLPSLTYGASNHNDLRRLSRSPAFTSTGYANTSWSGHTADSSSPPPFSRCSPPIRSKLISLPPVNSMFDEQHLFPPTSSPSLRSTHIAYHSPHSLGISLPVEPSYELTSQDSNDPEGSHTSSLALAPMVEARRHIFPRNSLDDRALRSFV